MSHQPNRSARRNDRDPRYANRDGPRPRQDGGRPSYRAGQRPNGYRQPAGYQRPAEEIKLSHTLPGIRVLDGRRPRILTKNLVPGTISFEYEERYTDEQGEWRVLDPKRSKLGAAIMKGLQQSGFKEGSAVLYLGASHGYTPSYVSDIIGPQGQVYCLDFAPRVVRDLVFVCESRENMAPILGDAKQPDGYAAQLPAEGVDVVYQDIAQKDQVGIFLRNCDRFLKQGGYGLLAVKARSIDVTRYPADIFKDIKRGFETGEEAKRYVIVDYRELDPFEKDHAFFVVKKK